MEHYHVQPASVRGHLAVPTSKSLTHRALIIAAFAANASAKAAQVHNPLRSDDTTLTLEALRRMGYPIIVHENINGVEVIEFVGKRIPPSDSPRIDIHHSGTSARLLTAVAAIQPLTPGQFIEIDGSERMRQRPMQELIQPLSALGAELTHENGFLPIRIAASLPDSENQASVRVDASKSSQFLSALLLIAPLLKAGLRIEIQGAIASQSYSDMTIAQMRDAGVEVKEWRENGVITHYTIAGGQSYQMPSYTVEGDYSSASYPLAAAAITGGSVTITNLRQHSPQGDRAIVDILQAFGAKVEWKPEGLTLTGDKPLCGVDWDMNSSPDIVPTVAVVAMFAEGRSTFRNIEH